MILNRLSYRIKIKTKRVKEYYAKHGLIRTITHYLTGIIYKSSKTVIFFELELANMRFPDLNEEPNIEVRKIKKTDLHKLDYNENDWEISKEEALNKLDAGCVLFSGVDDKTIASQQWIELKRAYLFGLELTVNLPDYTGYISRLYTASMYRGKGIATYTKGNALRYLQELGYAQALVIIDEKNKTSKKINSKFGFRPYQTVKLYRFLFVIRYYHIKDYQSTKENKKVIFKKHDQKLWKIFSKIHN